MSKKYSATNKDKKDWKDFLQKIEKIEDKEPNLTKQDQIKNKFAKLDLHGVTLEKANELVKKFIFESFESGFRKLLIITGKGLRSKVYNDPFRSQNMNVLRYTIPEYIQNDESLFNKISKVSEASLEDGGEGAIYVYLKKPKKL